MMTSDEFLAAAKEFRNFTRSHSKLCADFVNQYWLKLDGRFPNARVEMFEGDISNGWHVIVSDMKDGWPPDENAA